MLPLIDTRHSRRYNASRLLQFQISEPSLLKRPLSKKTGLTDYRYYSLKNRPLRCYPQTDQLQTVIMYYLITQLIVSWLFAKISFFLNFRITKFKVQISTAIKSVWFNRVVKNIIFSRISPTVFGLQRESKLWRELDFLKKSRASSVNSVHWKVFRKFPVTF